ncbi:DUF4440 domain-containing protein [Ktedonosporobacter rubrisoli]|uniref:DUF4440 domain-containing protein n=1 Tax=Ktedonosporobacter rubrisoli TaxID=2509675 RepID=A0A4P6JJH2_KTERU|nr:nuclear transport factor 2 family protein [Ktedonosporobacter rubrisoli]QBD75277.1 DUF4440 domain-containing protein [Ktedonosporobacter rubrisoli]
MATKEQDRQQIAALIEHYRHGFATADIEELKSIWDQDYEQIIYIAQEMAAPMRGWQEVEGYYERIGSLFKHVTTMKVSDVAIDILGEIALAFLHFHFEGELKGQLHMADGRVSFVLQRKSGLWKVIHYHESHPLEATSLKTQTQA